MESPNKNCHQIKKKIATRSVNSSLKPCLMIRNKFQNVVSYETLTQHSRLSLNPEETRSLNILEIITSLIENGHFEVGIRWREEHG